MSQPDVEYIDPAKSECKECKASFGVHLKTCSKFKDPHVAKGPITENQYLDLISWLGERGKDATHAAKEAKALGHAGKLKELPAALLPKLYLQLGG